MKKLDLKKTALIPIDIQRGFDSPVWGKRNNPLFSTRVGQLFAMWREKGGTILHVQHLSTTPDSPLSPESPGVAFMDFAKPGPEEKVIQKHVHSAFIGTELGDELKQRGIDTLILFGLCSDHCVSTTARMSGNFGYDTFVVSDATATFERTGISGRHYTADEVHDVSLASLDGQFADIVTTEEIAKSI